MKNNNVNSRGNFLWWALIPVIAFAAVLGIMTVIYPLCGLTGVFLFLLICLLLFAIFYGGEAVKKLEDFDYTDSGS